MGYYDSLFVIIPSVNILTSLKSEFRFRVIKDFLVVECLLIVYRRIWEKIRLKKFRTVMDTADVVCDNVSEGKIPRDKIRWIEILIYRIKMIKVKISTCFCVNFRRWYCLNLFWKDIQKKFQCNKTVYEIE